MQCCNVGHAYAFPVLKTSRAGVLSENGSSPFPCFSLDHPFIHLAWQGPPWLEQYIYLVWSREQLSAGFVTGNALFIHLLFLCDAQLKEFQQKSSPTSAGGEKGGGAGAKKKRKVKGLGQNDATSADRSSPDNVSHSFSICLPACHLAHFGYATTSLCT